MIWFRRWGCVLAISFFLSLLFHQNVDCKYDSKGVWKEWSRWVIGNDVASTGEWESRWVRVVVVRAGGDPSSGEAQPIRQRRTTGWMLKEILLMDGKWEILPFTFDPPCNRFYVLSQNTSFQTKYISLLEGNNVPNVCVNIDAITVRLWIFVWVGCVQQMYISQYCRLDCWL